MHWGLQNAHELTVRQLTPKLGARVGTRAVLWQLGTDTCVRTKVFGAPEVEHTVLVLLRIQHRTHRSLVLLLLLLVAAKEVKKIGGSQASKE